MEVSTVRVSPFFALRTLFNSLLVCAMTFVWAHAALASENPYETIESASIALLSDVENSRSLYDDDPAAYVANIEAIVGPIVDFERMAYLVMDAKYYRAATSEQRSQFVEVFKSSMIDTYSKGLLSVTEANFEIAPGTQDLTTARSVNVQQTLITSGDTIQVVYSMRKQDDASWLISNVTIDGVNLGQTFRNQFSQLGRKYNDDIDLIIKNWVVEED